jgi:hypothetical protein
MAVEKLHLGPTNPIRRWHERRFEYRARHHTSPESKLANRKSEATGYNCTGIVQLGKIRSSNGGSLNMVFNFGFVKKRTTNAPFASTAIVFGG